MILEPRTLEELQRSLKAANATGEPVDSVRLGMLNRLMDHVPADMTATVEAGMTLAQFQQRLAAQGQWLPLDPPNSDHLALGDLLSTNTSGPRRFGYGTVRDYLLGIRVALADGRLIRAGGKVVKNVAGYDLCKLFVGSHGTLGVIVEATFKLRPIPEAEQFVQAEFDSVEQADALIQAILESDLAPVVLDLHNLQTFRVSRSDAPRPHAWTLVLGFAGAREDVAYQVAKAGELGARTPSNLDHETRFWNADTIGPTRRSSVLSSELAKTIQGLGRVAMVARAGNGIIWYRGGPEPPKADRPEKLIRRVKETFDPKRIFPELPL